jgi:hypothetical protein
MERSGPGFFIPALKRTIEIESSRNAEALLPSAKAEGSHRDPELSPRPGERRDLRFGFSGLGLGLSRVAMHGVWGLIPIRIDMHVAVYIHRTSLFVVINRVST